MNTEELECLIHQNINRISFSKHAKVRMYERIKWYTKDQIKIDLICAILMKKIWYHHTIKTYKVQWLIGEYIIWQWLEIVTLSVWDMELVSDKNYLPLEKHNYNYIRKRLWF